MKTMLLACTCLAMLAAPAAHAAVTRPAPLNVYAMTLYCQALPHQAESIRHLVAEQLLLTDQKKAINATDLALLGTRLADLPKLYEMAGLWLEASNIQMRINTYLEDQASCEPDA